MRILFLTHRVPYAPNRGDRARAYHIVRLLASRVELDVISLAHDREEAALVDRVTELGATASAFVAPQWRNRLRALVGLASQRPLTHLLLDAPELKAAIQRQMVERRPDVVLAFCSGMARFAMTSPLSNVATVIDLVDVDSAKWARMAITTRIPMRWIYQREAHCLGTFERQATTAAAETLVVNEKEATTLETLAPSANIRIVPNGVDLEGLQPPEAPCELPRVIFCGVMNYTPNVEGVRWFSREVWPIVRASRPNAEFLVVGSQPTRDILKLASPNSGITVTGTVPDVRQFLWGAAVSVAPLQIARGVQNKVLEAAASGLPVVITPQVAAGLPPEVLPACLIGVAAGDFAARVLELLALSGANRRAFVAQADLSALAWPARLQPLYDSLCTAFRDSRSTADATFG